MCPMLSDAASWLDASTAAARIQAGMLSAETLARSCLDRIAARDDVVRAWTYVDPADILRQARELDRGPVRGPLHGLPIGVKDVILTADMPTQHNSPLYQGSRSGIDAACIMTLRAAGALIFGKTDTVEFAADGRRAASRNPHDPDRTPGGSSSGSAAAVADFQVPLALGTQTGGSTIRPSSFCGIYAMKPSWGSVSREGLRMYAVSLDTLGWYGRSVADLAMLADCFALQDDLPPVSKPLQACRIAICRTPMWAQAQPAAQTALVNAEQALRAVGATVDELLLPPAFDRLIEDAGTILRGEGRAAFLGEYRRFGAALHDDFRSQVENRGNITRRALLDAYDSAAHCRSVFDTLAAPYDAVLTLSATGEASLGLADTGNPVFNSMWTLLHVPCVGMPVGVGPAGLPVGLTLLGARFTDRRVLATAEQAAGLLAYPAGVRR